MWLIAAEELTFPKVVQDHFCEQKLKLSKHPAGEAIFLNFAKDQ